MNRQTQQDHKLKEALIRAPFVNLNTQGILSYRFRETGRGSENSGWFRLLKDLELGIRSRDIS